MPLQEGKLIKNAVKMSCQITIVLDDGSTLVRAFDLKQLAWEESKDSIVIRGMKVRPCGEVEDTPKTVFEVKTPEGSN